VLARFVRQCRGQALHRVVDFAGEARAPLEARCLDAVDDRFFRHVLRDLAETECFGDAEAVVELPRRASNCSAPAPPLISKR